MSYSNVVKQINKGKIDRVYCLYGTETYFSDEIVNSLEKQAVESKEDVLTYDLLETSLQDAIVDAETFPFFSDTKLIIIRNPVFLSAKNIKTPIEHDLTALERYLQAPSDFTTLVIIATYEKLDGRKKATKLLKKTANYVDCNPLKGQQTAEVVNQIANKKGLNLSDDARLFLENELQDNIAMMEKEIEKLAIFAGDETNISLATAEKIISPSNDFNALQFVDAVLKKDLTFAIKIYRELEKMKEDPIKLIGLLAYQFRIILQVKLLQSKGYGLDKLKQTLTVHPYVVQLASQRSRYFSLPQLNTIIQKLMETDEKIKRGKMEKKIAFEMLLFYLVQDSNNIAK